ncbi:hypothetical protein Tco_0978267 [Tanacetum coccineum]|uniref:Retrovirus-related Pol polyprotein from transposon TNT 1-94-like beta-barrel domain-containing protein n=1 Tax=Tanacetum coccineum TaxID=301880 RepID=A0ABQ5EML3_9ASTR
MLMFEMEKISNDSKDIQATMLQQIKILENDFERAEAQYINLDLKMQHQKEKNACDFFRGKNVNTKFDKSATLEKLIYVKPLNKNKEIKAKIVSKVNVKIDKSKPVTLCSTPKNEQDVASSSSVRRPKSKDTNSKERVLMNTKSKSTPKDVNKSQSSVSLVFNKRDIMNLTVFASNTNVLKEEIVNDVHDGLNLVCVSCGKDVFMLSQDKCVARYALSPNSRVKRSLFTSPVVAKSSRLGATLVVAKSRFSVATPPKATNKVIQIVLWIVDSRYLKHITRNLKLLRNFIEKFMGTIRFGNGNFAAIIGYGDYIQGNLMICHVYYVEGLEHNLFLVRQFCDGDLEVAFRFNTCYVRNLEGEDLLTGSRDSNHYTISISEMAASSLVVLMSKATSTKSWLWH